MSDTPRADIAEDHRPRMVVYVQPTSEIGGSDIALFRLVTRLDHNRYRPVVVLPREGPMAPKLRDAGITVAIMPMTQLRSVRSVRRQGKYVLAFWPAVWKLASLIRRERASIVHSNSLYCLHGACAAFLARVPHVWHVREIPPGPAIARRGAGLVASLLSARAVAMTGAVADALWPQRRPRKLVIINDGIDLGVFRPGCDGDRIRGELGIAPGTPVAAFVARLDPWKGAEVFVRAAAEVAKELPEAHFLVCGGGLPGYERYASDLRRLASDLRFNGRLHFTDWTYRFEDMPEVMSAVDVLVHTSVRPEPFGLTLVEAMAAGKPVVAAAAGGTAEVVEDGVTGVLSPPGDWQEAASAVTALLRDRPRAAAMGQAGRARAERLFEVGAYARKVQALYDDILSAGERARS